MHQEVCLPRKVCGFKHAEYVNATISNKSGRRIKPQQNTFSEVGIPKIEFGALFSLTVCEKNGRLARERPIIAASAKERRKGRISS